MENKKQKEQTKKNIWSIRFKHIRNSEGIEKIVFEKRLKLLDKKKYFGFIEERTYTTPKGIIIVETDLIEGTPAKAFRESIKRAGLLNLDFTEDNGGSFFSSQP